jgi:putative hydrolase of HD superfamily
VPPAQTESVADHSYRVAMMAWVASSGIDGLDRDRVIKLALLHDLAESVTGDLTPHDPVVLDGLDAESRREELNRRQIMSEERRAAKRDAENEAISNLIADLVPGLRAELASLWQELEERTTPEAQFVKQIDILETYLQSREYLAADPNLPVESFAAEVAEVIVTPEGVALRDAIGALRMGPDEERL